MQTVTYELQLQVGYLREGNGGVLAVKQVFLLGIQHVTAVRCRNQGTESVIE